MLKRIEIRNLRNIRLGELSPGPGVNVLFGKNGSGKTSVLEAIHLLSRSRSFKTVRHRDLIRFGEDVCSASGRVRTHDGFDVSVGVQLGVESREIRVAGQRSRGAAELVRVLPVQAIHPGNVCLIDGPPKLRRRFLDWGVFHVEHAYLDAWQRFSKGLAQRNASLRRGVDVAPWDHEVAHYGTIIGEARRRYLERLEPLVHMLTSRFLPDVPVTLRYQAGWDLKRSLLDVMHSDRSLDLRLAYTHSGPHKGDFVLVSKGRCVRAFLSRGQSKVLAYALQLAQVDLLVRDGVGVCALIDDLCAELDSDSRRTTLAELSRLRCQCFVTAIERSDLPRAAIAEDGLLFHVEQGRIAAS